MMTIDSNNLLRLIPCLVLALAQLGCNQPPPPDPSGMDSGTSGGDSLDSGDSTNPGSGSGGDGDGSGDGDGGSGGDGDGDGGSGGDGDGDGDMPDMSLYPLVDGATWSYVVKNTSGQILDMDVSQMHETTWEDGPAWELVDEPDDDGEWNFSILIRDGDLVHRVHREDMNDFGVMEIVDYDPGFLRASDAWTEVGPPQEFLYDRTAYDKNGQNPIVEARGHTFQVLAIDEEVTVPAGTFNCVKVERVRTKGNEAGALAWYWYAPGVGKVREENPIEMEVEELVSVSIPGGVELP
jgi:hypothetical protein